jgi:transposase
MISSIRLDGTTACMHLPGAADTEAFVTYLEEVLCPTLRRGDIVVMDNLAVHKSPQVAALIEAMGAEVRFLPAYSPDLNPIEKMWSKIKSLLRSYEARTPEELDEAISKAFSKITAKDAMGYLASLSQGRTCLISSVGASFTNFHITGKPSLKDRPMTPLGAFGSVLMD